ncbi:phage regulatory protein/antirepressor Ant [Sulfitobacter sp. R18_1]|uniref:phage regulatory protein/antirepressor Ant n=1 Tax=Sulfitobacter sp. R18_1 TaxID=2821104 RepID=UPI001FFDFE5D|nr:phage regulatory protein/antirepressor Ant [Sulfitobacter sp. R18_1]
MGMIANPNSFASLVSENLKTNSRIVADRFEKRHDNVQRDIRRLIDTNPEWGILNFEETPYVEPSNGQTYQMYEMTRDGYSMLVMGFTGKKAMDWKIKFLEAFSAMETKLRNMTQPIALDLNDPSQLVPLLANYAERTQIAEAKVSEMQPKAIAYDQLEAMSGSLSIRPAAKVLGIPEHKLKTWLQVNRWAFRQSGKGPLQAYTDKRNVGYLDHKHGEYTKSDGEKGISITLMITPKGLTKLAKVFSEGGAS